MHVLLYVLMQWNRSIALCRYIIQKGFMVIGL